MVGEMGSDNHRSFSGERHASTTNRRPRRARALAAGAAAVVAVLACSGAWANAATPTGVSRSAGTSVGTLDLTHISTEEVAPTATIPTGLEPFITMMAVAGGRVWATSFTGLDSIDPATNQLTRATDEGAFDLTGAGSRLVRDEFSTNDVEMRDAESGLRQWIVDSDAPAGSVIVGDEVWVADHHGGTLSVRRATDGQLLDRVMIGPRGDAGPQMPVLLNGVVWATNYRIHQVVGVDVATRQVVARVPVSHSVLFCQKRSVAIGDAVWISDCSSLVTRVDTTDLRATTVDVGSDPGTPINVDGEGWIAIDGRLVHVTNDLRADRAVAITGQSLAFEGVVAFGSAWVNVGYGTIARLPAPERW
jgi:hypothetical protein